MWRRLSPEEKAPYREAAVRPLAPCPEPAPPETVVPWPHCGDVVYPIRADLLKSVVADRIGELSKAWKERVGEAPVQAGPALDVRPPTLCEADWGSCRCVDRLDMAIQTKLNHFKKIHAVDKYIEKQKDCLQCGSDALAIVLHWCTT